MTSLNTEVRRNAEYFSVHCRREYDSLSQVDDVESESQVKLAERS